MHTNAEVIYCEDILGNGFEAARILQPDDYEGEVVFTLIRKLGAGKSSNAVLYIHGFNDYFFQEEMAEQYILNGYDFYAVDLRKYGRSHLPHQRLNNVRDLAEYDSDIDIALGIICREGKATVLLSGHSTGGLVVSLYANRNKDKGLFTAVFLNSPFWDMNITPVVKWIGIPVVAWWGKSHPDQLIGGGFSPLYGESLHRDFHGEWNYDLNWKPVIAPEINCGWIRAIHLGQNKIKSGIVIGKPLLMIHSARSIYEKKWSELLFTGDAVLNVKDMDLLVKRIKGPCTVKIVDGALHDVVLSKKMVREQVYQELFNWLKSF